MIEVMKISEGIIFLFSSLLIVLYCWAAVYSTYIKGFRNWPLLKVLFWILGVLSATFSVAGPVAERAMNNFEVHMVTHLLLGMLAPLLLVLSSPIKLLLRSVPVRLGRSISKVLKSGYVKFISHPVTASILNTGGLWVLYTTDLYQAMHHSISLHILVHIHVFAAGYLFSAAMIYYDPVPHRFSFAFRTVLFILALAGHGILSKFIFANPPEGVYIAEAERGAMLMYYGGDIIDAILIIILFSQWYRSIGPRFNTTKKRTNARTT